MTAYAIGLGSNVGDRRQHLIDACAALGELSESLQVSPLYETAPVGGPAQDPYLNAVAVIDCDQLPVDLLERLQEIESEHRRERKVRWGPRTLDLDVICADDLTYTDGRLTLPHPRAAEREFVLRPLVDLWPDAPVTKTKNASEALDEVEDQGVDYLSDDWVPPVSRWNARMLLAGQFALIIAAAVAFAYDGSLPGETVELSRVVGGAVAFFGLVFAFLATRRLGTSMTASPIPREHGELVIAGPYRFVRHPIYGGLSLFLIGTSLFLDSLAGLGVALVLVPYFLIKAQYEERQLRMRFADYLLYKQTVHRWLVPFLV